MGEILAHCVFLAIKSHPPQLSFPTLNFFSNQKNQTLAVKHDRLLEKGLPQIWKPMKLRQLYSETNSTDVVKLKSKLPATTRNMTTLGPANETWALLKIKYILDS